jgi:hypothetical protein
MPPAFSRALLWIAGLCFLGFGLAFLIAPLQTLGATGIVLEGALAATELRAFYGGLEFGLGLLLIAAARAPRFEEAGLWLCAASYGGIGLARLLGMVLAGQGTAFLWFALITELALAGAAAWALWRRSGTLR